ncbi:MAG TPA: DUF1697 domain-containing protein [Candidatus Saccharimonadales bacterium]|nr:DUF1697 domain-containing protein [Candidatus Saccharimonadales bacterium]
MRTYLLLLRGVNVGGKNKISMAELKRCLEALGFSGVTTYIASGNVIVQSDKQPNEIKAIVEAALPKTFKLDSALIKVLVLTRKQLSDVIAHKPQGFGDQPDKYHSDAIFLMDITVADAMTAFNPREGVDTVWPGSGVIYSQRLSALRTKSRLNQAMASPFYKSMTIRNWNTTVKLLELLHAVAAAKEE